MLYVDYGTIEIIAKSKIRLLKSEFGNLPIQALHCSLFDSHQNYPRELNYTFVDIVNGKILEATTSRTFLNVINII